MKNRDFQALLPTFDPELEIRATADNLDIDEARKLGLPVYWSQALGRYVTIPD